MPQFDNTKADKSIENLVLSGKIERKPGGLKGQIFVSDDFDEPMSEEELALWYDAPIFPEDETHCDQTGELIEKIKSHYYLSYGAIHLNIQTHCLEMVI